MLGINWNGSQFVAVGEFGTILTSPDAVTWTAQSGPTSDLHGITWNGSQYSAVGESGTHPYQPGRNYLDRSEFKQHKHP